MKKLIVSLVLLIPVSDRYANLKKDIDLSFSVIIVEAFHFLF